MPWQYIGGPCLIPRRAGDEEPDSRKFSHYETWFPELYRIFGGMYRPLDSVPRIPPGRRGAGHAMSEHEIAFEDAKARNEAAKARINEVKAAEVEGNVLPRDVWRDASATIFAMLAQTLRSLPDNLERSANLSPTQAEIVERTIDEALSSVAAQFKAMSKDA